jgi:predicted small lipoprotein YifL
MRIRSLAAAVAAAALAACGSSGSGPVPPANDSARANGRAAQAANGLIYGGGPVQTSPKIYVVFWGSAWNGSGGDPNGVKADLVNFYTAIAGSKWLATVTQYTQSNGQHVGVTAYAGSYVDTTSTPPAHPTQAQLAAEAAKAAAHFGGTPSISVGNYVVALPHGISPSGFGTQFCAYHATTAASGATIAWTALPYMPDAGSACGAGAVNSPGTLDGVSIISGGQQADVEVNPAGSGWRDSTGAEISAKCAWTNLIDNPAAGGFPTQPLWSNATGRCVQSYP